MANAIARFFRLLSAKRITIATRRPPNANMHTTAHVPGQKPCNHPFAITWHAFGARLAMRWECIHEGSNVAQRVQRRQTRTGSPRRQHLHNRVGTVSTVCE